MAILIECPNCRARSSENRDSCWKCKEPFEKGDETKRRKKRYIYWIEFYDEHKKIRRQRIGTRRSLAEVTLAKRKVEVAEGKFLDKKKKPKQVKFKALAKDYTKWAELNNKTPDRKIRVLNGLLPDFGEKFVSKITTWQIQNYLHGRKNRKQPTKKIKPATINREISLLKHIFSKAIEWKLLEENPAKPIKKLRENNKRVRFLSMEEITALLAACKGYLSNIVLVALNTGMRKGEIFSLRMQDIDLDREMIHISDSKNNETRDIPANKTLQIILMPLIDKTKDPQDYIFFNPKTKKPYDDVKKSFKTALKKAGIENFTFHDLRHTFASHLVMNGVDLMTIKELLGHKDIKMTMRYAHLSPNHKRLAVQKLESVYEAEKKVIELSVAEK